MCGLIALNDWTRTCLGTYIPLQTAQSSSSILFYWLQFTHHPPVKFSECLEKQFIFTAWVNFALRWFRQQSHSHLVSAFILTEHHPMGIYINPLQSRALPSGKREQPSQKFSIQTTQLMATNMHNSIKPNTYQRKIQYKNNCPGLS